jgi:hypothetical protein
MIIAQETNSAMQIRCRNHQYPVPFNFQDNRRFVCNVYHAFGAALGLCHSMFPVPTAPVPVGREPVPEGMLPVPDGGVDSVLVVATALVAGPVL